MNDSNNPRETNRTDKDLAKVRNSSRASSFESKVKNPFDLDELFDQINWEHFDGLLAKPVLKWNTKLRVTAGRFVPGLRKFWSKNWDKERPIIEVATYLKEEEHPEFLVWDTVAHEMIHYWLWLRGRPCGHTGEFLKKMRKMGVSRYNPVPKRNTYKHLYRCPECRAEYPARRILKGVACLKCCNKHAGGKYHPKFRLVHEKSY